MLRTVCGLILVGLAAMIAGCGGGGGGASFATPPQTLSALSEELTGVWTVRTLGLPNDQLTVQSDGQVLVVESATRNPGGQVRIGTCAADGALDLQGSWTSSGYGYSISATGTLIPATNTVSLRATLRRGNAIIRQDADISGMKGIVAEELDYPPPPPVLQPGRVDEDDYPPPPPVFD